jgi:hypothetical protein
MLLELFILASSSIVTAQSFWPSSIPLLLRSPYFNSWLNTPFTNTWPQFWTGQHVRDRRLVASSLNFFFLQILGWNGAVRVDNQAYSWLGQVGTALNLTNFEITPTRTILSFQAGPMSFNATFLSPIEPDDLVLQSLPFGYLYLDASSADGKPHSVQLYCDVSGGETEPCNP